MADFTSKISNKKYSRFKHNLKFNFYFLFYFFQISIIGLELIVKNCSSLEKVNLHGCHNVNDKAIDILTKGLQRLTYLSLENCFQLTDFSLDSIAINCKVIKVSRN